MTKEEYAILLTDERWQEVRKRILKRDKYKCTSCNRGNCKLNVHHKIYVTGKLPWEIPDRFLRTVCDICHEWIHSRRPISSFIKKEIPPLKKKNKKKRPKRSGFRQKKHKVF